MRFLVTMALGGLCLGLSAGCTGSATRTSTQVAVDVAAAGDGTIIANTDQGPASEGCDEPNLIGNAREVLERSCYPCHGLLGKVQGGMGNILDAGKLIAEGQVNPGNPEGSTLYTRMSSKQMPPVNTNAPLPTDEEIAVVKKWITCGADTLYTEAPRTFIGPADITQAIRADLEELTESQRAFARYFSLVNLYNAGIPTSDLNVYRSGLAKMVNSLSLGNKIVNPVAINETETLYRIYTDDYGWDYNPTQTVDIWESIVRDYPYGVRYEDDVADNDVGQLSGTKMAYVNADWFVAAASQPRLYHVILQLPNSERGLEQMVGVDTANNLATLADGLRAGFTQSSVSYSNRIIERHQANMGAYWKTFDFASGGGPGNVMYFSNGPRGLSFTPEENEQFFSHDGSEFIFELPNGLHAYMIAGVDGCRLDSAPIDIIGNPEQPQGSLVENGYSCMYCHREGIVPAVDDVRPYWDTFGVAAPSYAPDGLLNGKEYVDQIYEIYKPQSELDDKQNKDRADYQAALSSTGAVFGQYDPISLLKFEFDEDLDRARIAAELGVTPEDFDQYVVSYPEINGLIGSAITATISREAFQANFAEIVCTVFIGQPLNYHPSCGGTCEPDCADAICGDHDGCGGTCGECDPGHECVAGACYPVCGAAELCDDVVCDDGVDCTTDTCDIASGGCVFTPVNGSCADDDKCNGKEICDPSLGCLDGEPVSCVDDVACTVDTCDPFELCLHTPDDAVCDDGNPCDGVDFCEPTVGCLVAAPSDCDDGFDCTTDECDGDLGCVNAPQDEDCDDNVDCTVDTCEPGTGCEHTPDHDVCGTNDPCSDQILCDVKAGCESSGPADCDDGVPCTVDTCEPSVGCVHTPSDGLCGDGDLCNGEEICDVNAGCVDSDALDCADDVDCTIDSCDPLLGCTNTPNGDLCEDGVPCTTNTCDDLLGCVFVEDALACGDGLGCTVDVCDAVTGCSNTPNTDLCDDGIFCTIDACSAETGCSHTTDDSACEDDIGCTTDDCDVKDGCLFSTEDSLCDDALDCTADSCSPISDCVHDTSGCDCVSNGDCDDSNPCTADVCDNGSCASGAPADGCCVTNVECADGNLCTDDVCGDNTCSNPLVEGCCLDDTECDDGNLCTNDVCAGNACSNIVDEACCLDNEGCDDGDPCTEDLCADNTCSNQPIEACCTLDTECVDEDPCTADVCADNACSNPPQESCCEGSAPCPVAGNCGDGLDNDPDGVTDCSDADCSNDVSCQGGVSCNPHDVLACGETLTKVLATDGSDVLGDNYCGHLNGHEGNNEVIFRVLAPCTGDIQLQLTHPAEADDDKTYDMGVLQAECNSKSWCNQGDWVSLGNSQTDSNLTFEATEGVAYYVVVEGAFATSGEFTLSASCPSCPANACLNNVDCADADPCTDDVCTDNVCSNVPQDGCCVNDGDCEDSNPCTIDFCNDGNQCLNSDIVGCCIEDDDCKQPADGVAICVNNQCETQACEPNCGNDVNCWSPDGCGGNCASQCKGPTTCWNLEDLGVGFEPDPLVGCLAPQQICTFAGFTCGIVTGLEQSVNCEEVLGPCPIGFVCDADTNQCAGGP